MDEFIIRIKLLDTVHPLRIKRDEEELYRKAAKLVDTRFSDYKEKYGITRELSDHQFLLFTAFDLAVRFLKLDANKNPEALAADIKDITKEIEDFLRKK